MKKQYRVDVTPTDGYRLKQVLTVTSDSPAKAIAQALKDLGIEPKQVADGEYTTKYEELKTTD